MGNGYWVYLCVLVVSFLVYGIAEKYMETFGCECVTEVSK